MANAKRDLRLGYERTSRLIMWLTRAAVFFSVIAYAISNKGWLVGAGLGFLPAVPAAFMVGGFVRVAWPLLLLACIWFAWQLLKT